MSYQDVESGNPFPVKDPTQALASGIFEINTSLATFKRLVNTLGTPKDTPELRKKLHEKRQHINNLAKETSAKLKAVCEADHITEVSAGRKIADAKLAKDFHAILKEFQIVLQDATEKETTYLPFVPSSYTVSKLNQTQQEKQSQEQQALLVEHKREEVIRLDNEAVFNENLYEERGQGITEIQYQIGEATEIFKDLSVLVHSQGVMIDDVDSHIEDSRASTKQANEQLLKASETQKCGSSLACLLLMIFCLLLLIIIIVLLV